MRLLAIMDEQNSATKIQTNEQIVEELTRGLEDKLMPAEKPNPETSTHTEHDTQVDHDKEADDVDNKEESTEEEKSDDTKEAVEDYVDEEALKVLETSLSPEQLEELRTKAADLKKRGNDEFKSGAYLESIQSYTEALRSCPLSRSEERAVFYANRAAAKVQLERKESAIDDCKKAVELNPNYVRAYMRRAKLYEETDKLDESLEDYKKVVELDSGNWEARKATVRLPPLINERNEKLKTEMLGKLKDLGNVILKPFGLSTENFKMQQDPNTGGYSINFQQK